MLLSGAYQLHNDLFLLHTHTVEVEASVNVFTVSVKYHIFHRCNHRFVIDVESY